VEEDRAVALRTAVLKDNEEAHRRLRSRIMEHIDAETALRMDVGSLERSVRRIVADAVSGMRLFLNGYEQRQLTREIVDDMVRLGPIQPCMDDPEVNDILVNGTDQVLVERKGRLELTECRFRDYNHLLNLAQRIAGFVGRRIDESSPMVDARLSDGSRVNIIAPPLSLSGVCISIRKFSKETMDIDAYVAQGCMSPPMAEFLKTAARSRLNILVSGGTGSGKTTLLNALSQHISRSERIITIEDAAELRLDQPFVIRLETRPPSIEGKGEVTQRDLLRNALRMRPDRILLGEVRGAEAFDMLQAMNTGHDGSLSTVHANSPEDALLRLENMLNMGAHAMSSALVRRQLSSALDVLVQVERDMSGARRVSHISEVTPVGEDDVACRHIFHFQRSEDGDGTFLRTEHMPSFTQKILAAGTYREFSEALARVDA
jgi:pilus assembly protein CpaF